jgi:hypothetical protein
MSVEEREKLGLTNTNDFSSLTAKDLTLLLGNDPDGLLNRFGGGHKTPYSASDLTAILKD